MATLTNKDQFKKWIESELVKKKNDVADHIISYFAGHLLQNQPVEDGHAHEAWITAFLKANSGSKLQALYKVLDHFNHHRSHDPKASEYGDGKFQSNKSTTHVSVSNKLPFVYK